MTDPRSVVDGILELLVLPSFTRTGYRLRRRLFDWDDPEAVDLAGRTVVITGPTSGLGRAAAGSFARMGARLILVGRSAERLDHTRDELVSEAESAGHPPSVATVVADLGSLASVRTGAAAILESEPRIDVLIDNAGAMFPTREVTDEGFERSFAIMVLGPFVLLSHLLTRLAESPDPRVVAVTSGGMYTQRLPLDELDIVLIENVGNLLCPAEFNLGEHLRVVVASTPEGDDKPLKYPLIFADADAVVINKSDLLPYVDFDMERFTRSVRNLNARTPFFPLSCKTGEGVAQWVAWLRNQRATR